MFRVDLGLGRGNGVGMRRKRIADILEKVSVALFVGAYFQDHFLWAGFWAMGFAFLAFALCMDLTKRMESC